MFVCFSKSSSLSFKNLSIEFIKEPESLGSHNVPYDSSGTMSIQPGTFVVIIGIFWTAASNYIVDMPSLYDGKTIQAVCFKIIVTLSIYSL